MKIFVSFLLFAFIQTIFCSPIEKEKAVEECISELNLSAGEQKKFKEKFGKICEKSFAISY